MSNPKRKRFALRPSVNEASLESRIALSSGTGTSSATLPAVVYSVPSPYYAENNLTPPPAPAPVSVLSARAAHHLTRRRLLRDYRQQVRVATRDLQAAVMADIAQLKSQGAVPTAQQLADFQAGVNGALDATALRLSSQAALLPRSAARLVPAIQNAILGSGTGSLATRLASLVNSGQLFGSPNALTGALNAANSQAISLINNFFNSTPVNRLSVNSSGTRIPLAQFLGNQLVNQVGNTLGSLAQSFPTVANAMLFPNGLGVTPTQTAMNAFTTAANNALNTAAFQLGSGLSLFPVSTNPFVVQLRSGLFGSPLSTVNTGLAGALQTLPFGSPTFNTAVSTVFGNAFQGLVSPISGLLGMRAMPTVTLPTAGFINPFGTSFTAGTFNSGFNNGFSIGTTPGFIGFGVAPTTFNTNFGTGFNNLVSTFNQTVGIGMPSSVGLIAPNGTIGNVSGASGSIGAGGATGIV